MTARRRRRGAFEHALAFCRARGLFRPGDRVLVGTGSGAASLGALAFVLLAQRDLGLAEVAVGAVDMGGEADAEAVADAGRFARQLGAAFYAVSADGRPATAALLALARREGFARVVLGHTRDDAVARVLAGVAAGRGVDGLRPLAARARNGVVRPLLDLRDAEALELARTVGIEPLSLPPEEGARPSLEARLRVAVLPRLRVEAPGSDEALLALGRDVRALRRLVVRDARARVAAAQATPAGFEIAPVGPDRLLSRAVAAELLARLSLAPTVMRSAVEPLARLLRTRRGERITREVVLGPGLVATYLPEQCVVAVRIMRARRIREGVSG